MGLELRQIPLAWLKEDRLEKEPINGNRSKRENKGAPRKGKSVVKEAIDLEVGSFPQQIC